MEKINVFKKITIIIMFFLFFSLGWTSNVSGENKIILDDYYATDIDVYKVPTNSRYKRYRSNSLNDKLPAKCDPVDQSWFPKYVLDRNQYPFGMCWAFSSVNTAEISYAKKNKNGNILPSSIGHFGYFTYNHVADPLNLTANDKNVDCTDKDWYNRGGSNYVAFQAMANRVGLASESLAPYPKSKERAIYDKAIANNLTYTLDSAEFFKPEDVENYNSLIKQTILEKGAVATSLKWPKVDGKAPVLTDLYTTEADMGENSGGHAVTIIGWDDNYSKTKFPKDWYNNNQNPQNDGAWICVNSWGKSYNILHISYEDAYINYQGVFSYNIKPKVKDEDLYQYDGTSGLAYKSLNQGARVANTFKCQKTGILSQIGFTEFNEGKTDYTLYAYKNLQNISSLSQSKPLFEQKVSTLHSGYNSYILENPVKIKKGELFTIVVQMDSSTTYFGIEKSYENSPALKFEAQIDENQSFLCENPDNGTWVDVGIPNEEKKEFCFRIKGILRQEKLPVIKGIKLKAGKKKLSVRFTKDLKAVKYQVSVSTKKGKTVIKQKNLKKNSVTIKKLKSKKIYWVKIRGITKFGTYGKWSQIKKIRIK